MESGDRNTITALAGRRYLDAAPRSSFFALVSFLERISAGAARVGGAEPPAREAIRFRHDPGFAFSAADAQAVESPDSGGARFDVMCAFLGLSGATSPLPLDMTESVLFDKEEGGTQRDFLDLFHHRAISLLYRAVVRLDPAREYRSDASDPWFLRMLALAGVNPTRELALEPWHLMRLIPVLAKRSRGASALRVAVLALLRDEIPDVRVEIRELVGGWITINEDQCTRLGQRNHMLGGQAMLGRRVYDRRGRFAIRISLLSREQAGMFDEGQRLLDQLRDTVSLVVRDPLEYDVELVLESGALCPLTLGSSRLSRARITGFRGLESLAMRNAGSKGSTQRILV